MRTALEFFMQWNSRLWKSSDPWILFLYFILFWDKIAWPWEILSLHFCPTLLNPNSADALGSARLLAVPVSCSKGKPFVLSPFGQFSFFFPSNRSVWGLSSWEMHVAGGRAKCTKRKEPRYKLRHRHLADRFDVSVTSSAGQCSYPQSEAFVKCWNSENVTGISFAEHLESSPLRRSVFERSKGSTSVPSLMSSLKVRFWGASLCCRKLQCDQSQGSRHPAGLGNDLERLKQRSAWGRSCNHSLISK